MTITAEQVEFDAATHTYTVDGKVLPSVTQILQEVGLVDSRWFNDEACERGQAVAIITELYDKGILVDESRIADGLRGYLDAWKGFCGAVGYVNGDIEQPLASLEMGYAGTPDRVCYCFARCTVLDIKAGVPMPHYEMQTAGYSRLVTPPVLHRACVYLQANGGYKIRQHDNPRDWDDFAAALRIVNLKRSWA